MARAKDACRGSVGGDRFQLGGTFVISQSGQVLFSHLQKDPLDFSPMEQVIDICKREILECALLNNLSLTSLTRSSSLLQYRGPHCRSQIFPTTRHKLTELPYFPESPGTADACYEDSGSLAYMAESHTDSSHSLATSLEPDCTYALAPHPQAKDYNYFSNDHLFQNMY